VLNFQERPEARHFFHKKILKFAVRTFVPGGGLALDTVSALTSRPAMVPRRAAPPLAASPGARVGRAVKFASELADVVAPPPSRMRSLAERRAGIPCPPHPRTGLPRQRNAAGACVTFSFAGVRDVARRIVGRGPCIPPFERNAVGDCVPPFLGSQPGPDPGRRADVNGMVPHQPQPHPPVTPEQLGQLRLKCPAGYVLGRDDNCWWNLPRNSKWRKWKPGRKPMFTGGDLNAITRAGQLAESAEEIFAKTNPAKKSVARSYRANWRKPLKK